MSEGKSGESRAAASELPLILVLISLVIFVVAPIQRAILINAQIIAVIQVLILLLLRGLFRPHLFYL